jgi:thiol-disulfide isomerase/thioredoxin
LVRHPLRTVLVIGGIAAALVVAEIATNGSSRTRPRHAPALPSEVLVPPRATLAQLRGRPAVINFWASWCHPCEREAAELARFARRPAGGARLVGVDFLDDAARARDFIRKHGLTYPNLRDANGDAGRRYGVASLPVTFVLDTRGRISSTLRGPQTVETLNRAVISAGR